MTFASQNHTDRIGTARAGTASARNARSGTGRSLRSVHIYAALCCLIGLDLVVFGPLIADQAVAAPVLAATMDFGLYGRILGVGILLFGAVVAFTARLGGDWAALPPVMAAVAGVLSIGAALAGMSVLTPFGVGLLAGLGLLDLLFMVLMRRGLSA